MGFPSTAPRPDLPRPGLDELAREVDELKRRVRALEGRLGVEVTQLEIPPSPVVPALDIDVPARAGVLLGKSLLGIAGAYLLRALTDAAILPRGAGLAAGVAYAGAWLYLAGRNAREQRFAAVLHALTAVLIVGPLLWEATVRLQAISTWAAAGVIVAFAATGLGLSWQKRAALVGRIATGAAAVIAMTLLIASRDLLPFTMALLALAVLAEFAACCAFQIAERWLVALLSDLAVILLAYIVTRPGGMPEGYVSVSWQAALTVQIALVLIYLTSTVFLTFSRDAALQYSEIVQAAAVLLAGFAGAVLVLGLHPTVGIILLSAGTGCYLIALRIASNEGPSSRNYFVYTTLGFALLLSGACVVFSGPALVAVCAILAAICCWKGMRIHGAGYLVAGSVLSGAAMQSLRELFGSSGTTEGLSFALLIASSLLCYALVARYREGIGQQVVALVLAAVLTWLTAGAAARVVVPLQPAIAPTLRTLVLMSLSLSLAWCGVRWRRGELVWLMYAFMALGAYKLLTQDFPQQRTLPLVVSLLLYGSTLMVLSRVLRASASGTASVESGGSGGIRSR